MPVRRLVVVRPIHGFQQGDRLVVDKAAGQVDLVRTAAWDVEAVTLAELNGFLCDDPPERRTSSGTARAPAHERRRLDRRQG